MKLNYQRHQRDYSILITSLMMEAFWSDNCQKQLPYPPSPMYILVKDGILYHYLADEDKQGRGQAWLDNNNLESFKEYQAVMQSHVDEYEALLTGNYSNDLEGVQKVNDMMTLVLPLLLISYEIPEFFDMDKELLAEMLKHRQEHDDLHKRGIDLQRKLLNEIEKEQGLMKNTLENMSATEFREFLASGELPSGLEKRKKFFFIGHIDNQEHIYSQEQAEKILNEIYPLDNLDAKELKGQIAHPGKVIGKVRIINLIAEASSLEEGEILVTSMTDPRYLPAMKKAGAIVTDEGGITCHAAIVAREIAKPCIIGTKIATEVLHTGDQVEVDADKGIVKIIK